MVAISLIQDTETFSVINFSPMGAGGEIGENVYVYGIISLIHAYMLLMIIHKVLTTINYLHAGIL